MMPDNILQFRRTDEMTRPEHKRLRESYYGGCGQGQDTWPKRHKWGPWAACIIEATGAEYRERVCLTCSLVSDRGWLP